MDDIILTALIATVPLAMFSGGMGCVVLWRSMAYYGDAMAHAAMLGVALSWLQPSVPTALSVFAVTALLSVLLGRLSQTRALSYNTILAIFAYSALSIGILLVMLQGGGAVDIHRYLLGDMLTLTREEATITAAASVIGLVLLARYRSALVLLSIDTALASVAGIATQKTITIISLLLAAFIAFAVPLVGIVLVTSMLIIPAATARIITRTPEQMMLASAIISASGLVVGFYAAFWLDTPPAPTITTAFACVFALCALVFRAR